MHAVFVLKRHSPCCTNAFTPCYILDLGGILVFFHIHQSKSSLAMMCLMCNLKRLDEEFRSGCGAMMQGGLAMNLLDAITAASAAAVVIAALLYRL